MASLASSLITKQMPWHANMTEQNHLGAALIARPHHLIGKMDTLFSAQNLYSDNPISSMLMGNAKTEEFIGTTSWEWDLKGANTRPLIVRQNLEPENTTPGKWKRTFTVLFNDNWWVPGDVIFPGTSDKRYQCRVQEEPTRKGDGWKYTLRLMTDSDALFLPVAYLAAGSQWGKLFSQYEEAAEQSGSTSYSLPLSLENKMGLFRKKYKITGLAATEVLAVKIPDTKGKMHDSWLKYAEVEYWQQWYRERERGIVYSRNTDTVIGANGRPIRSGPGIQQQIETDGHIHRFTHLTTRLIEEYLMDIFYSRVKPGQGRRVKGFTGEYGMLIFHRAVQDWMTKSGFIKNVEVFTNKVKSEYHSNALETGFQFVRYNMSNGSSLELIHNPLYDDREINFEIDPVTGYPMESQRITFLDFTGDGGASNIKLMRKKDGFAFTYVEGMIGPYGPKKGGSSAHSGSYYEMHVEELFGAHIQDPTKCGELILSRN